MTTLPIRRHRVARAAARLVRTHFVRTHLVAVATAALLATLPPVLGAAPAAAATIAGPGGSRVDTFGSMDLLLPRATSTGGSSVRLTAARNEYESFQVKVSAGAAALPGVTVSLAGPLAGPGGATIGADNVRFYREDYYTLTTMSDGELSAELPRDGAGTCQGDCRIPDALIPERDLLTQEDRAAFPVTVPAQENRVAWVDVLVPRTAVAGGYTGAVEVRSGPTLVATVPLRIDVLATTLPSTTTMKSQVMVNANDIGNDPATYQQLAELALANRMTLVPEGFSRAQVGAALAPLLSGTDAKVPLAGARLTSFPLNRHADLAGWRSFLGQQGRTDLARFWCDEVSTATCSGWYDAALASFPGLRLQQIPAYQKPRTDPDLLEARTQTAVPSVTGLDAGVDFYRRWKAAQPGRELFGYTGCMQGGCNAPYLDNPLYDGTPGMGIDQPTSQARAMGWQGFRTGLDGEHYWTAAGAFARSWNACSGVQPTNCQYTAAGEDNGTNGDGNLFYSWNQAKVGGATPIPVESIRLKRFRDGREDNELMQLLAAKGRGADATAVATSLFPSFTQNSRTPAQVATARAQLEALVAAAYPPPPSTTRPAASQDLDCDGDADMLAVGTDGRLLFYPRQGGDWDGRGPVVAGQGWLHRYARLVLPGDATGDGKPDLLGVTAAGAVHLWRGLCSGRFTKVGNVPGIRLTDPTAPGDFDGDGKVDVLDQRTDGSLWLAAGNGTGGFATPRRVGTGWRGFTVVAAGDADRDGSMDVFGRRGDGRVFLYRGDGRGGWATGDGEDSGLVLPAAGYPRLMGPGDLDGDGTVDMLVLDSAGDLVLHGGDGTGSWRAAQRIGSGWSSLVDQLAD